MKVGEANSGSVSALGHAAPVTAAGGGRAAGGMGRGDQVQISTLGSQLNALDSEPASHVSKLVELSSAVSMGRYHVDAQMVSHKIIQEHMRTAA